MSIYQRKDGRWVATLTVDGKRRALYARTRSEAKAKLSEAQKLGVPNGNVTLSEWLWMWLESARKLKPSTVKGYASKVRCWEIALGDKQLKRLQPEDLDRAYRTWLMAGLSESSVNHLHRTLHRALVVALRRGFVVRNVADLVEPPPNTQRKGRSFTTGEARTVLEHARERRNGARWWLALLLGLRPSEVLPLTWPQVDLDRSILTLGDGKTRLSRRALPLPSPLTQLLAVHRVVQEAEFALKGLSSDLVFCTPEGRPVSSKQDWLDWRELVHAARVPVIRPYDARHTAATLLLELNVPAKVVSEILGHSTIRLTMDTYTHVSNPMLAAALSSLAELLTAQDDSRVDSRQQRKQT
ncbi:MAG: site-specific integrase [Mycobacterium sp.]